MPVKPNPDYAQPAFELKVCVICGAPAHWKYDKKGRPYHSCGNCQTRIFVHGNIGLTGIQVLHEMVLRTGVSRFRQTISARLLRVERKVRAGRPSRS